MYLTSITKNHSIYLYLKQGENTDLRLKDTIYETLYGLRHVVFFLFPQII